MHKIFEQLKEKVLQMIKHVKQGLQKLMQEILVHFQ